MPIVTTTSDFTVVSALRNGEEQAFDQLYKKYYPKLFNFLRKLCQSSETAEDLAHEVFMKIWLNRHELDPDKSFSSYLFTIAKHQLLNHIRKQEMSQTFLKAQKTQRTRTENQTESAVIFADYVTFFERIIGNLPPHKKHIFLLTQQQGKTHQEVADELRISKKTVEFHLRDCFQALRQQFSLHTDVVIMLLAVFLSIG